MKNLTYAILGSILLGTIAIFVKLIGSSIPVMTLSFLRAFFAFLFLLVTVPFIDKNTFRIYKNHLLIFFSIGFLFALTLVMFNMANLLAPVQNVVLINSSSPLFVLVFAYFVLKEKITRDKLITIGLAFVGLVIINPLQMSSLVGNVLALLGAVSYGLLLTLMRKEEKCETIGAVMWFFLFATIVLLPFPFIYGFGNPSTLDWVFMVLLGALSTGLAYLLINLALKEMEAETSSIITTVTLPLVSIILAVIIFSEALSFRVILGGCVLIISALYLQFKSLRS
jgi:drug/metabolite transporter (DMT)-like permease